MANSNKKNDENFASKIFKKGNYLYICIALGVLDGLLIHNLVIGIGAGLAIGIGLEVYMAKRDKKDNSDKNKK